MKKQTNCLQQFFAVVGMAVGLFLATTGFAQDSNMKSPEERAKAMTEKMKTTLTLDDGQYQKAYDINLKYAQKNQDIAKGSGSRFSKLKSIQASQKDKNKEMKAVLNADQYRKYEQMQAEMKADAKERWRARKD